jgi:hypothetical protein
MLRLFFLSAVGVALTAAVAQAQESKAGDVDSLPQIKSIQVGFGNHYKLGYWTPVAIDFSGPITGTQARSQTGGDRLEVQAPDCDGVPVWYIGPNVTASTGGFHTAYVRIGRGNQPIRARLTNKSASADDATGSPATASTDSSPKALPATNQFIVELGASIGLAETFARLNQNEAERAAVVTIDKPQPLPDKWFGYDGVDMVVVSGAPVIEKSLLSDAGLDALEAWVRQGGELLVCCGENAERVLGKDAPLARFAPGELAGVVNLPAARFGSIETFAAAEQRLEATSLRVPQWKNLGPDRRIELSGGARADDLPLVVRWPLGFGQVMFVGLDLHRPPFTQWPSRQKFLEKLLNKHSALSAQLAGVHTGNRGKQLGYIDLSGQLRSALDQFNGVRLIPFWAVAVLAVIYIALLFPVSYWIVIHWLKRQSLAWIMIPASLVVFCVAAYALANYAKGNVRYVNQVDLVDVDVSTGQVRGSAWFNVFSPENAQHNLQVQPRMKQQPADSAKNKNEPAANTLLGWFGLAGTGLGGMSSAAMNRPLFDEPYTIDPARGTISGVPMAMWSSQSFIARWELSASESSGGNVEATLATTADRRLRGALVNRLDRPLTDCVLLFDRWAYPLGTLTPGKSVSVDRLESQTIDTYLTKRRTVAAHDEIPSYDRNSVDVQRIIEVMMFYEGAGGANYAGLLNRYQRFIDLTKQLEFGRAILVGRGPDGAIVEIDGQPATGNAADLHTSVYRFVLEVKPSGGT